MSVLELLTKVKTLQSYLYSEKLDECHNSFRAAFCPETMQPMYRPVNCKLRLCPKCGAKLAEERSKSVAEVVRDSGVQDWRFITLTQPRSGTLAAGIGDIKAALKKWRRLKTVKSLVHGAYWQIEAKPKPDGWHVHIHLLVLGSYFPQGLLKRLWSEALGQNKTIVDIRKPRNLRQVCSYVSKYLCKATDFAEATPQQIQEFIELSKVRLWGTFGKMYRYILKTMREFLQPPPPICPICSGQHSLIDIRAGPWIYGEDWGDIHWDIMRGQPDTIPKSSAAGGGSGSNPSTETASGTDPASE